MFMRLITLVCMLWIGTAAAAESRATPETYRDTLSQLKPGDTLLLAPGEYLRGLPVHGLVGRPDAVIDIRSENPVRPAIFLARAGANTVSIVDSAHVRIADLVLEGRGVPVDAIKAEGHARWAHHVTIERLLIRGHDANQQIVGISTKCPTWGWIIRDNIIDGAGTGMYLGDSDGSDPFVGGVIEGNRIRNTIGYNLQIKHQLARVADIGMPVDAQTTIIRRNRFEKGTGSSVAEMARPNLLVGHFPLTGAGSRDLYLIYANVFDGNPTEALLQAEGNAAIYNNLMINNAGPALHVQPHNHLPRSISIFGNTIIAVGTGIAVKGGDPGFPRYVLNNAVFAGEPLIGEINGSNVSGTRSDAAQVLNGPIIDTHDGDFGPRAGRLRGAAQLPPNLSSLPDADTDLTGLRRRDPVFGACAAETSPCR
ncbi:MAG: right-handed parallel beta-helix repeat-containing protein [Burkholderiales bacterium]|nr:right-handed parallel beta-helix repeat-containing protein [Burkholderiales bacterium]